MKQSCLALLQEPTLTRPTGHPLRACLVAALLLGSVLIASAQLPYRAGDIVTTNFGLQNRFRWTNDTGQVFTPSNTTIRLHDFAGKIVFYCFFDVW